MAASEPEVTTNVDTAEVPSAEWGWSGEAPRFFRVLGWISVVVLLLFTIGNHEGKVEDLWLVGLAVIIAVMLVRDTILRRKPR